MSLYEIHINLDWSNICTNIELCKEKTFKYIFLLTPEAKTQQHFIITKWKHGTQQEAIDRAKRLANEIQTHGLKVTRIKVEGLLSEFADGEYQYAEFHLRVPIHDLQDFARLKNICQDLSVAISYVANKEHNPYLTLQFKEIPKAEALKRKSHLIDILKLNGFNTTGKMHSEAVIYDTNPDLDL